MKNRYVFIGAFFAFGVLKAQTVTPTVYSNQGGYNTASGGSISWTVGEPISETYTVSANITTMGFHQPELGVATLIKEQGNDKDMLVYPNPVKEALTVSFKDLDNGIYKMELFDAIGKVVLIRDVEVKNDAKLVQIDMSQYAAGNYYLKLANQALNRTIKITKTY